MKVYKWREHKNQQDQNGYIKYTPYCLRLHKHYMQSKSDYGGLKYLPNKGNNSD